MALPPAVDGFVSVSGSWARPVVDSFTGDNVGWVGDEGDQPRRGAASTSTAHRAKTVDLSSATAPAQAIVYHRSWPESRPHTIDVEVVGTAGRPLVDVDAFVRLR